MTWEEFAEHVITEGRLYLQQYPDSLAQENPDDVMEDFGCFIANKYLNAQ